MRWNDQRVLRRAKCRQALLVANRLDYVAVSDLRSWIDLLRREAEVDPHLEITEIVDRTVKAGGPALLFRNLKGSDHPLLINQFGTERRMSLAFGEPSLD